MRVFTRHMTKQPHVQQSSCGIEERNLQVRRLSSKRRKRRTRFSSKSWGTPNNLIYPLRSAGFERRRAGWSGSNAITSKRAGSLRSLPVRRRLSTTRRIRGTRLHDDLRRGRTAFTTAMTKNHFSKLLIVSREERMRLHQFQRHWR